MQRCKNVTVSLDNIQQVENQARDLLASLNDINFVLTQEEQQGLFSLIHALEWEPIQSQRNDTAELGRLTAASATSRLRHLLTQYRDPD
jgi:hypothetical protein